MEIVFFLVPWLLIGAGVISVSFWGGPGGARRAYLTRGSRAFAVTMTIAYIVLGVAIPGLVIANRGERAGGTDELAGEELTAQQERGKELFRETCASCHDLDAVEANGVTGPDLDTLGGLTPERVANAIQNGGTGQGRMPAGLLEGENARAVAEYVAYVAGR